ncbi:MAG: histidine--tRNA ligase [Candidatus Omnitrophota bacterium]
MRFQRLRGFQDISGDEARRFAAFSRVARRVFQSFGFEELVTPLLEEKSVFTRALGTETDVVQKEMYAFTDRSETEVALRPEGTAGVVRAYLENNFDKTQGLSKFYYMGPMFRSERPQAGRLRQFHQIGVETLGTESPLADAEAIHCLDVLLKEWGIRDHEIKMNNLGTFEERGAFREVLKKYFKPHEKALCEDCRSRLSKNVFRVLDCKVPSCRPVIEKSPPIADHLSEKSHQHFSRVREALDAAGVRYSLSPRMVRGLDYYTKTVFEVTHGALGAQDAVAAGGRYDHLIESFGGPPAGAVGFAIGIERILMVPAPERKPERRPSTFIVTLGEEAGKKGFRLLSELRGRNVPASMDFEARSLKSQMRSADKAKSRYVVILGDDEIAKGVFILKDMESGTQEEKNFGSAAEVLAALVKEKGACHA